MHVYACVYIYKTYIYMKYLWAETEPLVPEGFIIYVNPFHRGTTFKSLAEEVALARVWGQALLAEFTSDNDPWRGWALPWCILQPDLGAEDRQQGMSCSRGAWLAGAAAWGSLGRWRSRVVTARSVCREVNKTLVRARHPLLTAISPPLPPVLRLKINTSSAVSL